MSGNVRVESPSVRRLDARQNHFRVDLADLLGADLALPRAKPAMGPAHHPQHPIGNHAGGADVAEALVGIALFDDRDNRLGRLAVQIPQLSAWVPIARRFFRRNPRSPMPLTFFKTAESFQNRCRPVDRRESKSGQAAIC